MKDLFRKNRYYFLSILLFLIIGGVLLCFSDKETVSLWINRHHSPALDQFFVSFNIIGDLRFSMITLFFLLLLKDWKWTLKAALCFTGVMLVTQFAKYILFPDSVRPVIHFEPNVLRLLDDVVQLTTYSFPSGHTSASFAIATFFALLKSGRKWNFIFAFLALFVGYGRIYMSQHFITDVCVGMLIGVFVTTLIWWCYPKFLETR